jgi:hypothetical protein
MIYTDAVFSCFERLVGKRLELARPGAELTEDEIENSFNYSLAEAAGVPEYEIRLEFPHPSLKDKKVDLAVCRADGSVDAWCEVKYDKRPKGGNIPPTPSKAGHFVDDIFRLAKILGPAERLMIYMRACGKASNSQRAGNPFQPLLTLRPGEPFVVGQDWFEGLREATRRAAKSGLECCTVTCRNRASYPDGHELTVWEVRRPSETA